MDSPVLCIECESLFDSEVHFLTRPYRAVCPYCGQVQPTESDWKSYSEG